MSKRIPPRLNDEQAHPASARWQLGVFELDEGRRELRRGEQVIAIEPKPLNLLMLLVRHPGELITKDELIDRLWGGREVSETVIARCVSKLRAALGEHEDWLRTIHGYGYRYDGWVEPLAAPVIEALPARLMAGASLPGRDGWTLFERLGKSGDTWLARHAQEGLRVFKLAHDAARLTALKREATVHRLLSASPDADRQVTAALVPLLDWNFHAVPYFLEFAYCPAGNLADWLGQQHPALPRPQRLALVAQLAEQLSAIHALGVLHKDLKPDNILVTGISADGLPQLALADFGSGGVVDLDRLRNLGITRMGLTVSALDAESGSGTPLYLAPEVIAGKPWTRQADLYALGVLLYQVLVDDLRRPLAPGWERDIDDPLLCEDIAAASDQSLAHRLSDALELARRLRTLEPRRAAREAALRADEESRALRSSLRRSRMRRRWQGAMIAVLLLGLGVSSTMYFKAQASRRLAETASATATAVSDFLDHSVLGAADPYRAGGGRNVTIASVLDKAVEDFSHLDHQPQLQLRLGRTLASAYQNLGLEAQAREVGLVALRAALQSDVAADDAQLNALRNRLGWIDIALANYDESRAMFEQIIARSDSADATAKAQYGIGRVRYEEGYFAESAVVFQQLLDSSPADGDFAADVRWELAETMMELHDWQQAKTLLAQVRQHLEQKVEPSNAQLLWLNTSEAYCLQMLQDFDAAEALLQHILTEGGRELGEQHPISLTARQALGVVRIKQARAAEALALIEPTLAARVKLYGESHYLTRMSMGRKAEALMLLGDSAKAEPLLRKSWQASELALGRAHPHTLELARLLAECLASLGQVKPAEALFREVLALGPQRMPANNNRLAWARFGLARLLIAQGDPAASQPLLQQAAADFRRNFPATHTMHQAIEKLLQTNAPAAALAPALVLKSPLS